MGESLCSADLGVLESSPTFENGAHMRDLPWGRCANGRHLKGHQRHENGRLRRLPSNTKSHSQLRLLPRSWSRKLSTGALIRGSNPRIEFWSRFRLSILRDQRGTTSA